MSNKKSYMNRTNILSEGFFSKLFKAFNIKDKSLQTKIKKDKKFLASVRDLNGAVKDMEQQLYKDTGKKIKLQKFSIVDFF